MKKRLLAAALAGALAFAALTACSFKGEKGRMYHP